MCVVARFVITTKVIFILSGVCLGFVLSYRQLTEHDRAARPDARPIRYRTLPQNAHPHLLRVCPQRAQAVQPHTEKKGGRAGKSKHGRARTRTHRCGCMIETRSSLSPGWRSGHRLPRTEAGGYGQTTAHCLSDSSSAQYASATPAPPQSLGTSGKRHRNLPPPQFTARTIVWCAHVDTFAPLAGTHDGSLIQGLGALLAGPC